MLGFEIRNGCVLCMLFFCSMGLVAQKIEQELKVQIQDPFGFPISGALLQLQGTSLSVLGNRDGICSMIISIKGKVSLLISAQGFETARREVVIKEKRPISILVVLEVKGGQAIYTDAQEAFLLSEFDLESLTGNTPATYLLQATRDVFLGSVAFDFSQAFFKPKSLDARYGSVFINGIPMNKRAYGRPQWSDWGGLNSLTRNQTYTHGIQSSANDFGGLLGTTSINLSPSNQRPGLSFSSSFSNRSYALREMISYVSPVHKGFSMALGTSLRAAKRGYQEGTSYKAYSALASLEYQWPKSKHKSSFSYIQTFNKRGRSSALTKEVSELMGTEYNPYWGFYKGKIRSARNKTLTQQMFLANHEFKSESFSWTLGIGFAKGKDLRNRLAYFNAPNPDPIYYRNLPSYYLNSPIGANFYTANTAREALLNAPQIDWGLMYKANENLLSKDQTAYLEGGDQMHERQRTFSSRWFWKLSSMHELDIGLEIRATPSRYFGQIIDLLGGLRHADIDPFSKTRNDLEGPLYKTEGDTFGYDYQLHALGKRAYVQWRLLGSRWDAFASLSAQQLSSFREGFMQNERYLETSFGKSRKANFKTVLFKSGLTYKFNGRHRLSLSTFAGSNPPVISKWFINPRDQQAFSPNLSSEKVIFLEVNYNLRVPKLIGRFNVFWGRFSDQSSLQYFFTETALGSDFFQQWVAGQNTQHLGIEFGFSHKLSSAVQLNFTGALGNYEITNQPNLHLFFHPDPLEQNPINSLGVQDFGRLNLEGSPLSNGPARAFSLAISYRDPKYWWLSMSMNSLGLTYVGPSYIRRTKDFLLDPDTQLASGTQRDAALLLKQFSLPSFYIVNLVGGKSWLKKGRYVSLFLSVNNLFNTQFSSGGYQQSRKGYLQGYQDDQRSGQPSFDTKYWNGASRTFFLNMMISLPPSALKKSKETVEKAF
jgi:hypothetical protein